MDTKDERQRLADTLNREFLDADIKADDITMMDGQWTIDGMIPWCWADAMFGED